MDFYAWLNIGGWILAAIGLGYAIGIRSTRNEFRKAITGSTLLCDNCKTRILREVFNEREEV